ncbi:MAG: hypothetical protein PUD55_04160 [Firmicutes bacterium]|nr:hypothetical protein [Bacillota bacterium]
MAKIIYLNPAGNITAVIQGADTDERLDLSREILASGKAEQVGFEVEPYVKSSLGRLEMAGGEFCGNATRAYAFYLASKFQQTGVCDVTIEISGANEPVHVNVDLDKGEAYTDMPLPLGTSEVSTDGTAYPVVRMEGIDHMIVQDIELDADEAIDAMISALEPSACGVLYVTDTGDSFTLKPYVYVNGVESRVWESSCGSGSVALAWVLGQKNEQNEFSFEQPGGTINVRIERDEGRISHCYMGGAVSIDK